jgi:hypothetical protein
MATSLRHVTVAPKGMGLNNSRWGLDDFLKDRTFDALSYPASR